MNLQCPKLLPMTQFLNADSDKTLEYLKKYKKPQAPDALEVEDYTNFKGDEAFKDYVNIKT